MKRLFGNQVPVGRERGDYHSRPVTSPAQSLTGQALGLYRWSETNSRQESTKITTAEAAVLQSYPPDFEFVGNKGEVGQQIGNAVPPRVVRAALQAVWA